MKEKERNRITKKIKHKLDTSSKMQFAFLNLETLKNLFGKLSILSKNLEMTHSREQGVIFFASL